MTDPHADHRHNADEREWRDHAPGNVKSTSSRLGGGPRS